MSNSANSDPELPSWTPLTRLAFRFAFCYFTLYAFCCGNATVWEMIPRIGGTIEIWMAKPFWRTAQWLGPRLFHLQGVSTTLHMSGSGDRPLDWIALGILFSVSVIATLVWTALDRKRMEYRKLQRWFRFALRLTLAYAMLYYGLPKLLPQQMPPPSLAVLNEPVGNTSPMTLLWTLIGLNPVYEMICGAVEVCGGFLLIFRRTALLGALLTAVSMSNVVLYNFCFDVSVKQYAAHLLLITLVLLAPDIGPLFNFLLHRPIPSHRAEAVPSTRLGRRIEILCITVFLVLGVATMTERYVRIYAQEQANLRNPPAITGQWHIDAAEFAANGTSTPQPYFAGDGLPITDIFFEPTGRANLRAANEVLWRARTLYDGAGHTLWIVWAGQGDVLYDVYWADTSHVVLSPAAGSAKNGYTLHLTKIPLPQHYPLLDRGSHLINEWPFER